MKQCDCWTDSEGFWKLGPNCQKAEMDEWRRAMDAVPKILEMIRKNRNDG